MYQLAYYADIKDINEVDLRVEIYKDADTTITAGELILSGDDPIVIEYDADGNIYKPLIQSTCTIKVVTAEPLLSLYTGKLNEVCVSVYKANNLVWHGYLTPNIYSQDYYAPADTFELEFVDAIAQLEYVKFTKVGFFKSFYDYVHDAITAIDKKGIIKHYLVQQDLPIDIQQVGCMERNFVDETGEDDNTMTYKDLLESIMLWLGKSMIHIGEEIYIVDLSVTDDWQLTKYDRANGEYTTQQITRDVKTVTYLDSDGTIKGDVEINKANCSISLGDVYNKVTVIANTNQIANVMPDVLDEDKKVAIMAKNLDYTTTTVVSNRSLNDNQTVDDKTYTLLNAFFVQKDWGLPYGVSDYGNDHPSTYPSGTTTLVKNNNVDTPKVKYETLTWWIGSTNTGIKLVTYNIMDGVDAWYEVNSDGFWVLNVPYKNGASVAGQPWTSSTITMWSDPYIQWKQYSGGSGQTIDNQNVTKVEAMTCVQKYADWCKADGEPSSLDWKTVLTFGRTTWDLDLDKVWTGTFQYRGNREPDTYIKLINKPSFVGQGGYLILSMSYILSNVHLFGNTAPYNFTSEVYGESLAYANTDTDCSFRDDKFKCILTIGDYSWDGNTWSLSKYMTQKPSFYIAHKNKKGDKIFGTSKSIDNTVSYAWNLASSKDGYAIPLPTDKVLSGELSFVLYADSRLGGNAQINNHGWIIPHHDDAESMHEYDGYVQNVSPILAIHVDKLELTYTTKDTVSDVYNLEEYDPDIKYTNVINDDYVTELDDIELKVNTYNTHAVSYSYVLSSATQNGDTTYKYVTDVDGKIQEHRLIEKYVNHYKSPKLTYSDNFVASQIKPFNPIYIQSLNKSMIPVSMTYYLADDRVGATITEI